MEGYNRHNLSEIVKIAEKQLNDSIGAAGGQYIRTALRGQTVAVKDELGEKGAGVPFEYPGHCCTLKPGVKAEDIKSTAPAVISNSSGSGFKFGTQSSDQSGSQAGSGFKFGSQPTNSDSGTTSGSGFEFGSTPTSSHPSGTGFKFGTQPSTAASQPSFPFRAKPADLTMTTNAPSSSGSRFKFGTQRSTAASQPSFPFRTKPADLTMTKNAPSSSGSRFKFGTQPSTAASQPSFPFRIKPADLRTTTNAPSSSGSRFKFAANTATTTTTQSGGYKLGSMSAVTTSISAAATSTTSEDTELDIPEPCKPTSGFTFGGGPTQTSDSTKAASSAGFNVNADNSKFSFGTPSKWANAAKDEDVLFSHRAKLYRFDNGEWKERGLGDVKVLFHTESKKARIVMRREQILKLCCNHYVVPELSLNQMPNSKGCALVWFAIDCADGEAKSEKLSIKFKTAEIATEFEAAVEDAKTRISGNPQASVSQSMKASNAAVETIGASSNIATEDAADADVIFVSKETATEEEIKQARALMLPDHFYLYKRRPSCPGCRGCDDRLSEDTGDEEENGQDYEEEQDDDDYDEEDDDYEDVDDDGDETDDEDSDTQLPSQHRQNGTFFLSQLPSSDEKYEVLEETFRSQMGISTGGMGNPHYSKELDKAGEDGQSSGGSGFVFGARTSGEFSFSYLAQSNTTQVFKTDESKPFSWDGAGKQLFGAGSSAADDNGEEGDVQQGEDQHFEPVVPLPDLVDVKTGEEEEVAQFSNRAKLFRFDKTANQWKEKGIGEMKILKHKETGKYRLLLRREQVHKLACNHLLTPNLTLTPMNTSETSWCWIAQDFSDNEPKIEKLAVKFKTIELAKTFKDKFEEIQAELKSQGEEEEVAQFSNRAKLFRFDKTANMWKEKGIGEMKILKHKETGKYHLLLRRERVHKLACNHFLTPDLTLTPMKTSETIWCWIAQDFSDNEPKVEQLAVQFKTIELAKTFKDKFEEIQAELKSQGEEEEVAQFSNRAKLFRFDKTANMWKEKGIGEMKILKHKETGKYHLLLRRERVHKLACNHFLTPDLTLTPMKTSETIWCWIAQDFSDNEPKVEKLAVQFKTIELAKTFKDKFEEIQAELKSQVSEIVKMAEKPLNDSIGAAGGQYIRTALRGQTVAVKDELGEKGAGVPFEYPGHCCTLKLGVKAEDIKTTAPAVISNSSGSGEYSGTTSGSGFEFGSTPTSSPPSGTGFKFRTQPSTAASQPSFPFRAKPADLTMTTNAPSSSGSRFKFGTQRSTAASQPSFPFRTKPADLTMTKNAPSSSGSRFKFGTQPSTAASQPSFPFRTKPADLRTTTNAPSSSGSRFKFAANTATTTTTQSGEYKLGSMSAVTTSVSAAAISTTSEDTELDILEPCKPTSGFTFGGGPTQTSDSTKAASSGGFNVNADNSKFSFGTPSKWANAAKDEDVLFSHRAKLYLFDNGELKEHGLGDVKVLFHTKSKKARIVMRREQILKLCCNHYVVPELSLYQMPNIKECVLLWFPMDYADVEPKSEKLSIKFKTVEIATEFEAAVEDVKSRISGNPQASESQSLKASNAVVETIGASSNIATEDAADADVIFVSKETATEEEIKQARALMLPDHFYLYKRRPSCPGCRGCDDRLSEDTDDEEENGQDYEEEQDDDSYDEEDDDYEDVDDDGDESDDEDSNTQLPSQHRQNGTFFLSLSLGSVGIPTPKKDEKAVSTQSTSSAQTGLLMFKQKPGSWTCEGCYIQNYGDVLKCPCCCTLKPGVKAEDIKTTAPAVISNLSGSGFKFRTQSSDQSGSQAGSGFKFRSQLTNSDSGTTSEFGFKFGSTPTSSPPSGTGFKLGTQPSTAASQPSFPVGAKPADLTTTTNAPSSSGSRFKFAAKTATTTTSQSGWFKFGSMSTVTSSISAAATSTTSEDTELDIPEPCKPTSGFTFGGGPAQTSDSTKAASSAGFNVNADNSKFSFGTPSKWANAAKDEDVLFSHRAKLYLFDNGELKEHGLGDVKVLFHAESKTARIVMRREQILKLCCNHYVVPEFRLYQMPNSKGCALVWFPMDCADGEPKSEKLSIKFKTVEIATEFEAAVEDAKTRISGNPQASASQSLKASNAVVETIGASSNIATEDAADTDVIFVSKETATEEEIKQARALMLPDHFYLYKRRPTCPGCRGCDDRLPEYTDDEEENGQDYEEEQDEDDDDYDEEDDDYEDADDDGDESDDEDSNTQLPPQQRQNGTFFLSQLLSSGAGVPFEFPGHCCSLKPEVKAEDIKTTAPAVISNSSGSGFKFETQSSDQSGSQDGSGFKFRSQPTNSDSGTTPGSGFKFGSTPSSSPPSGTGFKFGTQPSTAASQPSFPFGAKPADLRTTTNAPSSSSSGFKFAAYTATTTTTQSGGFKFSSISTVTSSISAAATSTTCEDTELDIPEPCKPTSGFTFGGAPAQTSDSTKAASSAGFNINVDNSKFSFSTPNKDSLVVSEANAEKDVKPKSDVSRSILAKFLSSPDSWKSDGCFVKQGRATIQVPVNPAGVYANALRGQSIQYGGFQQPGVAPPQPTPMMPPNAIASQSTEVKPTLIPGSIGVPSPKKKKKKAVSTQSTSSAQAGLLRTPSAMPSVATANSTSTILHSKPISTTGQSQPTPASAASMLSQLAAKYQDDKQGQVPVSQSTPQKTVFQGFPFTSTPNISGPKGESKTQVDKPIPTTTTAVPAKPFSGFSFTTPTQSPATTKPMALFGTPSQAQSSPGAPPFMMGQNSGSALSFGSLATQGQTAAAFQTGGDSKDFMGVGQPLFGKSPSPRRRNVSTGSDDHQEEYEPNVDFKPVVPLPDLIEVKTGEEDEEKLFCERAKLFRFDKESNQWKERGIGEMKILKHQQSKKVRILMRREQVLKLCANHTLTEDMKLTLMSSSDKAWVWNAMDFAEEEMKYENFAIKLKNADVAQKFKDVFEKCQAEITDQSHNDEKTKKSVTDAKPDSGAQADRGDFSALFKQKPSSWTCEGCYIQNNGDVLKCPCCCTLKPGVKAENIKTAAPAVISNSSGSGFKFRTQSSDQSGSQAGSGFKFRSQLTNSDSGTTSGFGFKFGSTPTSSPPSGTGFKFRTQPSTAASQPSFPFGAKPADLTTTKNAPSSSGSGFKFAAKTATTTPTQSGGFKFGSRSTVTSSISTAATSTTCEDIELDIPEPCKQTSGFTLGGAPAQTSDSTNASSSAGFNVNADNSKFSFGIPNKDSLVLSEVNATKDVKPKSDVSQNILAKFLSCPHSWKCDGCFVNNDGDLDKCPCCNAKKPTEKSDDKKGSKVASTVFGTSTKSDFKFGSGAVIGTGSNETKSAFTSSSEDASNSTGFSFGTPSRTDAKPDSGAQADKESRRLMAKSEFVGTVKLEKNTVSEVDTISSAGEVPGRLMAESEFVGNVKVESRRTLASDDRSSIDGASGQLMAGSEFVGTIKLESITVSNDDTSSSDDDDDEVSMDNFELILKCVDKDGGRSMKILRAEIGSEALKWRYIFQNQDKRNEFEQKLKTFAATFEYKGESPVTIEANMVMKPSKLSKNIKQFIQSETSGLHVEEAIADADEAERVIGIMSYSISALTSQSVLRFMQHPQGQTKVWFVGVGEDVSDVLNLFKQTQSYLSNITLSGATQIKRTK